MRRLTFLAAGLALACGSDGTGGATAPPPPPPPVLHTDTVAATPALTGYVLAYTSIGVGGGAHRSWFGAVNPMVGDNDAETLGSTMRGVIGFRLPTLPAGDTFRTAMLTMVQCQMNGTPFDSLGSVVADHLAPTAAPDSATYDTAAVATTVATITNGPLTNVALTTSVAADYAAGDTTSIFRLRFTPRESDGDDIDDNVAYCSPTLVIISSP
jgi:hypothetical protein